MKISESSQYAKECKRLCKKYPRLSADIERSIRVIVSLYVKSEDVDTDTLKANFFRSNKNNILHINKDKRCEVVKIRVKSSDMNNDSIRLVFVVAIYEKNITLIEIFAKNKKGNEDTYRWQQFIKS